MIQTSCILRVSRQASNVVRYALSTTASHTSRIHTATRALRYSGRRNFHASCMPRQIVNKDAEKAKPTEEEFNETEETIPVWQNPLHQEDENMKKQFEEDFERGEMPINPLPPFETDVDKVVAPPHVHDLAHEIVHLNLLELKELTNKIADHFGFDEEMMAASYGGGGGQAATTAPAEEVQEEKTIFDLKLVSFDAKAKIKVIKEVRSIAGLGLKEAKELVESAPKIVQKDLKPEKAEELKAALEAVGAVVEVV